jgi:predicted nuclease of predicted toxin-antitoxin system
VRLLADENVPQAVALALRDLGLDVVRVVELAPGSSDNAVERLAAADGRAILTFD